MKLVNGWVYVTVMRRVYVEGIAVPSPSNTEEEREAIEDVAIDHVITQAKTDDVPPGWEWAGTTVNAEDDKEELYSWT